VNQLYCLRIHEIGRWGVCLACVVSARSALIDGQEARVKLEWATANQQISSASPFSLPRMCLASRGQRVTILSLTPRFSEVPGRPQDGKPL